MIVNKAAGSTESAAVTVAGERGSTAGETLAGIGDPRRPRESRKSTMRCREFISIPYSRVLTRRSTIMTIGSLERESKRNRRLCAIVVIR